MEFFIYRRFGKRVLDASAALLGLLLCSPLFFLCAVLVKVTSSGPVLFRQTRVGRNGRTFQILKFRTMVNGAERLGPGVTTRTDARVTTLGRLLRRTKWDELPQLWNVAMGDMSLVGPRPELPCYVALYTPEQKRVLEVRPGITDLASLTFRDEERILAGVDDPLAYYKSALMPRKLALNLEGIGRMSLRYDVQLIAMTVLGIAPHRTAKTTPEAG